MSQAPTRSCCPGKVAVADISASTAVSALASPRTGGAPGPLVCPLHCALVPGPVRLLNMRKRWQQQAAASRLAKSPRADKKGSGSADSAEAGANKASLVDKAGDRASEPPLEISVKAAIKAGHPLLLWKELLEHYQYPDQQVFQEVRPQGAVDSVVHEKTLEERDKGSYFVSLEWVRESGQVVVWSAAAVYAGASLRGGLILVYCADTDKNLSAPAGHGVPGCSMPMALPSHSNSSAGEARGEARGVR
eukprot:s6426_g6.t1